MTDSQKSSIEKAKLCDNGIFVEVGTWYGNFAKQILEKTNCKKLYCVDPYKKFSDEIFPDAINSLDQNQFDSVYELTKKNLSIYGDRVEFLRLTS